MKKNQLLLYIDRVFIATGLTLGSGILNVRWFTELKKEVNIWLYEIVIFAFWLLILKIFKKFIKIGRILAIIVFIFTIVIFLIAYQNPN